MRTNERQRVGGVAHGGRELHLRSQELCLLRRGPEEVDFTCLELVDRTVDFQLSALGQGSNGLTELQKEVDGVEHVHLHRCTCDIAGARCTTQLLSCLGCHGSQPLKKTLESAARRLGLSSLLDGQVRAGSPGQCSAVGVAHDHDEAAAQLANAKLQAAQEASFGMRACVAGISQDEEVARGRVKERLHRGSRVSTANDGSMWSLALVHQGLPHVLSGSWGLGRACHVALVAALEVFQGLLRQHRVVCSGANRGRGGLLGSEQRRRHRSKALRRHRLLLRRGPKELDLACLQLIDTAMDLQLATLNLLAEALAVLQQEVDGVEDVHLHGVGCHGLEVRRCTLLTSSHLSHRAQVVQQSFQGGARTASPELGIEVALRGAVDGTALRVSQHENQARSECSCGELEASDEASFGMGAGVPGISQNEDVPGHSVEDLLQWRATVGAADDGGVRSLALLHQQRPHFGVGLDRLRLALDEASVAFLQELQSVAGSDVAGLGGTNSGVATARHDGKWRSDRKAKATRA
mmetsp:Transcript_22379/g.46114  ORF Transcript_22379/g.46114 Transcript_22379/m.46114 type:complete len:522 (-) Transcript_22379:9-1574(-)